MDKKTPETLLDKVGNFPKQVQEFVGTLFQSIQKVQLKNPVEAKKMEIALEKFLGELPNLANKLSK